ncbi:MAG: beta-agarase [Rikenellaceae bacterium]
MKITTTLLATLLVSLFSCSSESVDPVDDTIVTPDPEEPQELEYEWDLYAIPIEAPAGQAWVLQDQSDEFNYEAPADTKSDEFFAKWTDFYHNSWTGPTPTIWQRDHVSVTGGVLRIIASRPSDVEWVTVSSGGESTSMPGTYTGCITSTKPVSYPAYIEAYAQLSNSTMASDVWMLSADDTQEIDIIEAYGGDRDEANGKTYYGADRLHLSHHVFIRDPFQDYQPTDAGSWYADGKGTLWRDDFHRIGVYWRDPFYLAYYVDGDLVRVVSGENIIDPYGYTDGTGLVKELDIIINMEDQSWRAIGGLSPTDEELLNEENCTFKVDWIRVYNLEESK